MIRMIGRIAVLLVTSLLLISCMDKGAINADFKRMDQTWGAENRLAVSDSKHKLLSTNKEDAVRLVEKTFMDLGMTVVNSSVQSGYVLSKSEAPTPLSEEEWESVRAIENPKLAEYVGWMISIERDPSAHFVIVKATIAEINNTDCEVILDASMEMPKYANMGLVPFKEIPPHALNIATNKIWTQLNSNVAESKLLKQRRR